MNILTNGMGKLYPYLKVALIIAFFTVARISETQAQVDVKIDILLGLTNSSEEIVVSPNPFYNELKITHGESIQINVLKVVDSYGQVLYELQVDSPFSVQLLLNPGNYFLVMETNLGTRVEQVVLED
ncbi:MAG: T9SS type A sorting domain-containing protein [Bacteroidota bacterium]